jgi:L-fuconolactonase
MDLLMPEIIDAHQHFWQLSLPFNHAWLDVPQHAPIRRDFLPADLKPHLSAAGVQKTIFVQVQHNVEETRWALGLAEEYPFIAGVVGWVDLASASCETLLLELKQHPKFVGVRHLTQGESDDDFIVRADVLRGLGILQKHGVPFDLLLYVKHLRHVPALARHLPELPMVIDHLAKPNIKDRRMEEWLPGFRAAAAFSNIYCKLSGLVTEADWRHWQPADLKPYVQTALDCFGPQRLLFGSDWPVCTLAGSYQQVYDSMMDALGPLSDADRQAIFGETARKFYRI